ncbi:MAG: EamA family transporter, partial [Proteobacteria bacterium]|nr:EamA family transporter [Pseudomonadota bacterium]
PLLVLAAECVKAGRWPGPRRIAVFVTAFTGLGIALGPDLRTLDPIGIGLAFSASLGTVLFLFSGQRAAQHMDGMAVTALANFVLLPLAVGAVLATDGLQLPSGHLGWAALIGVGIAYLTGVTLQFMALRLVAPSLSALVLNVEPVLSIGIAWIVVGETMSALQLVGVGLAVSAISAGAWLSRTRGVMQES